MKRSPALPVAAVLASMSLAGPESTAQPVAAPARSLCRSLWVTASNAGKPVRGRKPLNFSAREVLDLEFQVVIPADAAASGRELEVKLFTPKGHLYQTLAVSAPKTDPGTSPRRGRFQTVIAQLPVAGTTIVNNSLYGTWQAQAFFEGDASACVKPRSFVIKP
jgi:hypothetical protein